MSTGQSNGNNTNSNFSSIQQANSFYSTKPQTGAQTVRIPQNTAAAVAASVPAAVPTAVPASGGWRTVLSKGGAKAAAKAGGWAAAAAPQSADAAPAIEEEVFAESQAEPATTSKKVGKDAKAAAVPKASASASAPTAAAPTAAAPTAADIPVAEDSAVDTAVDTAADTAVDTAAEPASPAAASPPPVVSSELKEMREMFAMQQQMLAQQAQTIAKLQQQQMAPPVPQFPHFPQFQTHFPQFQTHFPQFHGQGHFPQYLPPQGTVFVVADTEDPKSAVPVAPNAVSAHPYVAHKASSAVAHKGACAAPKPVHMPAPETAPAPEAAASKSWKQSYANKQTPHTPHKRTSPQDETEEFAPFDLLLNDECEAGFACPNSRNTKECPLNHQKFGTVILKGKKLPRFFCKFERPWLKKRCTNPECYNAHLAGRIDHLVKIGYLTMD